MAFPLLTPLRTAAHTLHVAAPKYTGTRSRGDCTWERRHPADTTAKSRQDAGAPRHSVSDLGTAPQQAVGGECFPTDRSRFRNPDHGDSALSPSRYRYRDRDRYRAPMARFSIPIPIPIPTPTPIASRGLITDRGAEGREVSACPASPTPCRRTGTLRCSPASCSSRPAPAMQGRAPARRD